MSGRGTRDFLRVERAALLAAALAVASPAPLQPQELGARIREAGDGALGFRYPTREGVRVCRDGFVHPGGTRTSGRWRDGWDRSCVAGGAEVRLEVADGSVRRLDLVPPGPSAGAGDLGSVSGPEAAEWLLQLARGTDARRVAREAVPAATLAADARTWPTLLEMARDPGLGEDLRRTALFWVGQEAAEAVTDGVLAIAGDPDEDQDIRDAAVFALSQRPDGEGVPALIQVARTAEQAETRRSAVFWLAQKRDDRVVAFFREVLLGPP